MVISDDDDYGKFFVWILNILFFLIVRFPSLGILGIGFVKCRILSKKQAIGTNMKNMYPNGFIGPKFWLSVLL